MTPRQKRYHIQLDEDGEVVMEAETDSLVEATKLVRHFVLQGMRTLSGEVWVDLFDREEARSRCRYQPSSLLWMGIMTAIRDSK